MAKKQRPGLKVDQVFASPTTDVKVRISKIWKRIVDGKAAVIEYDAVNAEGVAMPCSDSHAMLLEGMAQRGFKYIGTVDRSNDQDE